MEECSVGSDDHGKLACYYTQLHASNASNASDASLPEFLRHCSSEDAVSPMHSYTMQLLHLGEQGGGSPAILAARKTEYVISAHDAISPTLALTRAPSRRALAG